MQSTNFEWFKLWIHDLMGTCICQALLPHQISHINQIYFHGSSRCLFKLHILFIYIFDNLDMNNDSFLSDVGLAHMFCIFLIHKYITQCVHYKQGINSIPLFHFFVSWYLKLG